VAPHVALSPLALASDSRTLRAVTGWECLCGALSERTVPSIWGTWGSPECGEGVPTPVQERGTAERGGAAYQSASGTEARR